MATKGLSALLALVTLVAAEGASAQWTHRYPKTEPFSHQLYVEQEHLPILSSGPTYPASSPDGKSLAVSHQGWIWLLDLSTGTATRLTNGSAIDARPRWSTDGTRIAFVRDSGTDTAIVIARLDGGPEQVINTPAIELDPEFTKDGKYLVYTSARAGRLDLWRRDLQSGVDVALTQGARLHRAARSLRDGGLVHQDKPGRSDALRYLDADGKASRILVEQGWMAHLNADTHPMERAIVYGVGDGNHVRLAVMDIDQPAYPRWLTAPGQKALFPSWSADGSQIYYVLADTNQQFALMVIDAAGGEPKRVPVERWDHGAPMGELAIVVNGADARASPARLSVTRADGHPLVNPAGPTFVDNQNGLGYFYTDGRTSLELPQGEYRVVATRGPFSVPRETAVHVRAGTRTAITLDVAEIWDAHEAGFVSVDHHVHLNGSGVNELELESLLPLMQGEKLDFAAPMAWNQHNRFIDAERIGQRATAANGTTALLSQEVRSDYLGHIGLIGAKTAFQPWFFGPDVPVYGNRDLHNGLASAFAAANGLFPTYVHPVERDADPFLDLAANELPYELVLDGVLTDGMGLEIVCQWTSPVGTAAAWYRFLNIGRVMPATAGTDMMANFYRLPAIGTARAYVPATSAKDRYAAATEQVRSGKGFVTTGPALLFDVDGAKPGGVVEKGRRAWTLELASVRPVVQVEIVVNGRIVQTLEGFDGGGRRSYAGTVDLPSGGWLAARAVGGKTAWPIMSYAHFAHTQPIWIGQAGSVEPDAARAAAVDLLAALAYSESQINTSYGTFVPPGLTARIKATRTKLTMIAAGDPR